MVKCYCCSGRDAAECCEPFLSGAQAAPTPEALMRSRYSAFCTKNLEYVEATTDPQAMSDFDRESTRAWMDGAKFSQLEILSSSMEGTKGRVEFKAHFQMADAPPEVHHEISRFRKQAGTWFFREGKIVPPPAPKN